MWVLPLLSIKPAPGALVLYQQGRLTECLERVRGSSNASDAILAAEALLRLGRPNEVIRMDVLSLLAEVPKDQKYLAQSILAFAYFTVGMASQGQTALKAAYENLDGMTLAGAAEYVNYVAAYACWQQQDYDRAERMLKPAIMRGGVTGAKALSLLAWVQAGLGNYRTQVDLLRQAWIMLPLQEDVYTGAKIIHALAYLSCELYDAELASFVERAAERIPWTTDLVHQQIETMRAVAWNNALSGRIVPALRQFRRNEFLATTDSTRLVALLDRARISHGRGELENYQMFLESADEIAAKIHWGKTTDDERFALLSLAALWSPKDALRARAVLEKYQSITTPVSPTLTFGSGDPRRTAAEEYTAGVVARFLGHRDAAMTHLRRAFAIYRRTEHYWRAALCAHHLDTLGADASFMECALIWIRERFPHAWFRTIFRDNEQLESAPAYRELTRTQRSILHLLLQGKSTKEIAETLDRVEQTVRNHVNAIYKAFHVHRQQDLIQICTHHKKDV